MSFDFSTAGRIIFGRDSIAQLEVLAAENGSKPFLLTGGYKGIFDKVIHLLAKARQDYCQMQVEGEPTVRDIQSAVEKARVADCDYVIGCGGGSVLDSAKAVAVLLNNPGDILQYLEIVGENKPITNPAKPCIVIPTTAGTGSEVTRNAVLAVPEKKIKVSMRSPLMLPKIALVDPLLTVSLPPAETAYTGMDALTQVVEPYVSIKRNDLTDGFCREGIARAARSLKKAYLNGKDLDAREDMSYAGLMGGLSLANAGLGMVHGFAGVIGGMFNAHHGAVCACLLPAVIQVNILAMQGREPHNPALARYQEIASIFTGSEDAEISVSWEFPGQLKQDMRIPDLKDLGISHRDFEEIIFSAKKASSTKGNPISLETGELKRILEMSF